MYVYMRKLNSSMAYTGYGIVLITIVTTTKLMTCKEKKKKRNRQELPSIGTDIN